MGKPLELSFHISLVNDSQSVVVCSTEFGIKGLVRANGGGVRVDDKDQMAQQRGYAHLCTVACFVYSLNVAAHRSEPGNALNLLRYVLWLRDLCTASFLISSRA